MFDNDSYVARPPAVIKARQRLCLEAISFSINTIVRSLNIVRNIVNGHHLLVPPDIIDFSAADKIPLCSNLWAVVGQTHMLIKLLKELDSRSSVVDRFISIYSVASKMLNKIDHIHSNIQNIMNSNKSRPTIFGSLSYFVSNNTMKNASGQKHGIIVCVNFGSLTDKRPDFPAIIPLGKPVANGASLFEFYAFDSTLPIHLLFNDVAILSDHLESLVRESADAEIERLKREGAETANLLIQPTSFIATAKFTFGEIASVARPAAPLDQSESPPRPA